jgi:hypothetical protein
MGLRGFSPSMAAVTISKRFFTSSSDGLRFAAGFFGLPILFFATGLSELFQALPISAHWFLNCERSPFCCAFSDLVAPGVTGYLRSVEHDVIRSAVITKRESFFIERGLVRWLLSSECAGAQVLRIQGLVHTG